MTELTRPFVRLWDWTGSYLGFPGQVFFICAFIILTIGFFTWLGNRR